MVPCTEVIPIIQSGVFNNLTVVCIDGSVSTSPVCVFAIIFPSMRGGRGGRVAAPPAHRGRGVRSLLLLGRGGDLRPAWWLG